MKHIKKIDELVGFGGEEEPKYANRQENGLRSKVDSAVLYFLKNENKIDLDFMELNNLPLGEKEYQQVYKDIIQVLKKHKRFKK